MIFLRAAGVRVAGVLKSDFAWGRHDPTRAGNRQLRGARGDGGNTRTEGGGSGGDGRGKNLISRVKLQRSLDLRQMKNEKPKVDVVDVDVEVKSRQIMKILNQVLRRWKLLELINV